MQIYYKDWGRGRTVVFGHRWPLSEDAFEIKELLFDCRAYLFFQFGRR
jgi:non-heme chloroperoxidase